MPEMPKHGWTVFAISDWKTREGEERASFREVGRAFQNRDGSLNVYLDALPLQGKLQLRERPEPEPGERAASSGRPP